MTPVYQYAGRIKRNWSDMPSVAKDAVTEMFKMDEVTTDARKAIGDFLASAGAWRGEIARQVKSELRG